jgi:hypothetical protein
VAPRLSEELRSEIAAAVPVALAAGDSVRTIAARFGVSPATVSAIAREVRADTQRSQTKSATAAKTADLAARRARISERLVEAAERALDDMNAPSVIYNFGGKDNTYAERPVSRPPVADQRQLATIAAIALDKHRMLDQYDAQQGMASAVDDWLLDRLGVRRGNDAGGEEGA